MTTRQVLFVAGAMGLLVSSVVLVLLWYHVAGVLVIGKTDLVPLFWPSSVVLVVGRCRTILGVLITVSSVVINCMLYMTVAYSLRGAVRLIAHH